MPKKPTIVKPVELSQQECFQIIDEWLLKIGKASLLPRQVTIQITIDDDRGGSRKKNVEATAFGDYLCLRDHRPEFPDDEDYQDNPWCVSHIPTGLSLGFGYKSKVKALLIIKACYKLMDWNFSDNYAFMNQDGAKTIVDVCRYISGKSTALSNWSLNEIVKRIRR